MFVNSDISPKHIDVFGFDYDYTLVKYTGEVHRLIYDQEYACGLVDGEQQLMWPGLNIHLGVICIYMFNLVTYT